MFSADESGVPVLVRGARHAGHEVPLPEHGRRGRARGPRAVPLHALRHRRLRVAHVPQVCVFPDLALALSNHPTGQLQYNCVTLRK